MTDRNGRHAETADYYQTHDAAAEMDAATWEIREVTGAAISKQKAGDDLVPMSVLLAAAEEYHHRRAS